MKRFFTDRVQMHPGALSGLKRDQIGWDHDPLTATFMMHDAQSELRTNRGEK